MSLDTLPDDCVCELVRWIVERDVINPSNDGVEWYRIRTLLGLLSRAAQQTFEVQWSVRSQNGAALLAKLAKDKYAHVHACYIGSSCKVLRLASLSEAHYKLMSQWLGNEAKMAEKARYTPRQERWYTHVRIRHSDYHRIRHYLRRIHERRHLRTPRESLALYLDVCRLARFSDNSHDIQPRPATNATRLDELFVYNEPVGLPAGPLTHNGLDLRGMQPVATHRGKGSLWAIRHSRAYTTKTVAEYYADRYRRMKLLRRPIKRLAHRLRSRQARKGRE